MNLTNYDEVIEMLKTSMRISLEQIIKENQELDRVLKEYKEFISMDVQDINMMGELTFNFGYAKEAREEILLNSIMYRKEVLLSYIKAYEYIVSCYQKIMILKEYKDDLIMHSINKKINNSEYRKKCPYLNYQDYQSLSVSDLCQLLDEKAPNEAIDYDILKKVLDWLCKKNMFEKVPNMNFISSLEDKGIFKINSSKELQSYLEYVIACNINSTYNISDELNRDTLARLRSSSNLLSYLSKDDYNLRSELYLNEGEHFKTDFMRFKEIVDNIKNASYTKIEGLDLIGIDTNTYVNSLTDTIDENDDDLELPAMKKEYKKGVPEIFGFSSIKMLSTYKEFDDQTLKFINRNTNDEQVKGIIEYILQKRNLKNQDVIDTNTKKI